MPSKTVQLTAPNGTVVTARADAAENLLRHGFTTADVAKTPAKKAPSKSKK